MRSEELWYALLCNAFIVEGAGTSVPPNTTEVVPPITKTLRNKRFVMAYPRISHFSFFIFHFSYYINSSLLIPHSSLPQRGTPC